MTGKSSKTKIRRIGRAVKDDEWIKGFLRNAAYGTLATADGDQPFLNINTFVYDDSRGVIYFHTALRGKTREIIVKNDKVCFGVAEMGRLLPAESALGFSVEYKSVIVFGRAEIVEDPDESRRGLDMLMAKYFPKLKSGVDFSPITEHDLKITSVYKIIIEEWSGKQKAVEADFPGAFFFENRSGEQ